MMTFAARGISIIAVLIHGVMKVKRTAPSMKCIAKYRECTSDIDSCCNSLSCTGDE